MADKLIMIDGNSLIFRAFHALPPMNMNNGVQVNAAYGFFSMLLNLVQEQQPQYMAVAFDLKGPTFRKEMYAGYKATRSKTPEELLEQFPLIKAALNLLNIKILQIQGYEADDIIGTMTARADAEGMDSYIYTGDRDSLQLISEHTKVMLTKKGVSEIEVYDREHLQEMLGLEPWQIVDMKGLMGDASDNIPGIAGIGEKTALKLLHQFGSVEQIYERIDELPKNKMREKVENGKESAFFSKQLATIERNVPLHVDMQELRFEGLDSQRLYEVLDSFGFQSMIKRLGLKRERTQKAKQMEIRQAEDLAEAAVQIRKARKMALCFDKERFLFSAEENVAYSVDMQQNLFGDTLSWQQALQLMKDVLEDETIEKTVYDAKGLRHVCAELQIAPKGIVFDVMLAEYVLNPTLRDFSLAKLQDTYDAEESAAALFVIRRAQEQAIEKQDLGIVFYEIEMPLCEVLFQMEEEGFEIDTELLKRLSQQYADNIEILKEQIYELAGTRDFNIASTKQLGSILFEKLGLPVVKKTKTGYSTNAEVLEKLSGMHPIIEIKGGSSSQIKELCKFLSKREEKADFILTSFSGDILKSVRENMSGARIWLLTFGVTDFDIAFCQKYGVECIDSSFALTSKADAEKVIASGIESGVWTTDKASDMEKLYSWGVKYATTNSVLPVNSPKETQKPTQPETQSKVTEPQTNKPSTGTLSDYLSEENKALLGIVYSEAEKAVKLCTKLFG